MLRPRLHAITTMLVLGSGFLAPLIWTPTARAAAPADNLRASRPAGSLPDGSCPTVLVTTNTTLSAGDLSFEPPEVTVSGATLTVSGPHAFCKLTVRNGGVVTHAAGDEGGVALSILTDCMVDSTSAISVNNRGYAAQTGPGSPITISGGAAHGGEGGSSSYGGAGSLMTYDSLLQPSSLGSGGGPGYNSYPSGAGGGAVWLTVTGVLHVDGSVSANGQDVLYGGCGAGGGNDCG